MINYRLLKEEDLEFFNSTRNECREFLHDNREFTLEQTKEWFKSLRPRQRYYLIHSATCRLGYIRVVEYDMDYWDIGMDLCFLYRGLGISKPVYEKFMGDHPEVTTWGLEVLATNTRAYNLYLSLGFKVNPDLLVKNVERNGRFIPSLYMATDVP